MLFDGVAKFLKDMFARIEDIIDIRESNKAMKEYREKGGKDWEELKKELGFH